MKIFSKRKIIILNENSADMQEINLSTPKSMVMILAVLTVFIFPIISYLWFYFTNPSLKEVSKIRSDNKELINEINQNQTFGIQSYFFGFVFPHIAEDYIYGHDVKTHLSSLYLLECRRHGHL